MTWFRKELGIQWLTIEESDSARHTAGWWSGRWIDSSPRLGTRDYTTGERMARRHRHHWRQWAVRHRRASEGQGAFGRTPFGAPSDKVILGELDGIRVAFLSRHGRGHRINPSDINYRANIYALKSLGVQRVISVSAVGSMKESIKPGDVVLADQFIDFTKRRASTFFERGIVAHVAFGDPVCASLGTALLHASRKVGATVHQGGVYLLHRRATVFDQGGVPTVSSVGCECDRDDESP